MENENSISVRLYLTVLEDYGRHFTLCFWNGASSYWLKLRLMWVNIVNILYFAALFLFWGFLGDSLLLKSIKRKIAFEKKEGGKTKWINMIYKHEKVMLFRAVSVVVLYGLGVLILSEVPERIFFAIVY